MPSKANQNLADLFAMSAPERGLMLSLRGCEAALPCSRWWLAFIPLSTAGGPEPGWQLLKEEAKGLKPIWPPANGGVGEGSGAAVYLAGAALRPVSRRAALALVGQCAGWGCSVCWWRRSPVPYCGAGADDGRQSPAGAQPGGG